MSNDFQSYGELEKYIYGGSNALSYFSNETSKVLPVSQKTDEITKHIGTPNFGYSCSYVIDKTAGDFLTNLWLSVDMPEIQLKDTNKFGVNGYIRWTENVLHNLISEVILSCNESVIAKLDNFALDFLSEFNIPDNKYSQYMRNIGNVPELASPNKTLNQKKLFLPLQMFFFKETFNALPLCALPHSEIKLTIKFRHWENLLIFENNTFVDPAPIVPLKDRDINVIPSLKNVKLFGTFVSISEEERTKIVNKSHTFIIEQIQTSPRQMVENNDKDTKIDLLFKQSVKTLYFAIRNSTFKNVWSNYNYNHDKYIGGIFCKNNNHPIVETASIKYNDIDRVPEMPAEFYSFVNSWYHCERTPTKSGIYMYSFALDQKTSEPSGGVSLNKIDNPSLNVKLTEESRLLDENYELIVIALTNNVIKISEGTVQFPVV